MIREMRMRGQDVYRGRWLLCGKHKAISLLWVILLLLSVTSIPVSSQTPDSATPVSSIDSLPTYEMDLLLDAQKRTIGGSFEVTWTNSTGTEQSSIYFRLYPNADYYSEGEMLIEDVRIDDQPVAATIQDDPTVLEVTPESPIAPDESIMIGLQFQTVIPVDSDAGYGIFQCDSASDIWNLANWYPILAGYEAETGWYLQEPTQFGDPTFSETAQYRVAIEVPDHLTVVSTGETTATQSGFAGYSKHVIETGPAREFVLTLLPSDVSTANATADDIRVNVTLPATADVPGLAQFMADTAAEALEIYESWMGEYPSAEFDISVADLSGANAVSWSGLTWFSLESIVADGELTEAEEVGLAFVILHEVGHQWIADIVGSNNNDHGFMTEGFVNALTVLAAEQIYGADRASLYLRAWVAGPYSSLLNDGRDGIADAPLTDETIGVLRTLLVYGKAAVGFIAIREEIGEEAFLIALDDYTTDYRFTVSEPDDLQAAFELASGDDLNELWSFWFNEDTTTRDDLNAVLDAFDEQLTE